MLTIGLTVTYMVDDAVANLVEVLLDAVFLTAAYPLHDKVLFPVYQNHCVGASLLIDFGLEIKSLFLKEIDFGVDLVINEFVLILQLDRLYVHQMDLLNILHFAGCQTHEVGV